MPLLKVSEIVEIFLVPDKKNFQAVAEIKDSMLERVNCDYQDWITVEWDEDLDDYNVVTKQEHVKDNPLVDPFHLMQIETLMLLIFKDDLHNLHNRDEQRKVQFLAHLVKEG